MPKIADQSVKGRLVKDTLRILNIPRKRYKSPLVVLFSGPPASGKTLIAKEIERRLPFCRLTTDLIRSFIVPSPTFYVQETKYLDSLLEEVLRELVKAGVNVIYDTNLAKYRGRQRLRKVVEMAGGTTFLVYLICSEEKAFERIMKRNEEIQKGRARGRIVDREYYRFIVNTIEAPGSSEKAFRMETSHGVPSFERLILELKKELGPCFVNQGEK